MQDRETKDRKPLSEEEFKKIGEEIIELFLKTARDPKVLEDAEDLRKRSREFTPEEGNQLIGS